MLDAYQLGVLANSVAIVKQAMNVNTKNLLSRMDIQKRVANAPLKGGQLSPKQQIFQRMLAGKPAEVPMASAAISPTIGKGEANEANVKPALNAWHQATQAGKNKTIPPPIAPAKPVTSVKSINESIPSSGLGGETDLNGLAGLKSEESGSPEQQKVINEQPVPNTREEAMKQFFGDSSLGNGALNWSGDAIKKLLWHIHPSWGEAAFSTNPAHLAIGTAAGLYGLKKLMEPDPYNPYGGMGMGGMGMGGMGGMPHFGYY